MLSQTAEHALRAVLYLAQKPKGEWVSAAAIAEAIGAPRNYLSKTLNVLAQRGLLLSVRGPAGGFRLSRPAEAVSVAEVIEVFDEPRCRTMCLLGGRPCSDATPCEAHVRWTRLARGARDPLLRLRVSDLLPGSGAPAAPLEPVRVGTA